MHEMDHLKPPGQAKFKDRGIQKAGERLIPWEGQPVEGIGIIGAPLSKTSISHSGAALAPDAIRKMLHSFTSYSIEKDVELPAFTDLGDITPHVTNLAETQSRFEKVITELLQQHPNMVPIVLGGDHSISASSISAFAKTKGRIGVIQFDAHHDLRNLEDGGPSNGTPFRNLIESNVIEGEDLIQVGIRDFSNGKMYSDYAKEKNVTVYTMSDVNSRGIIAILEESVKALEDQVNSIYVSVDMDALDQAFAPGCPAIGPGGMNSDSMIAGIQYLASHPKVKGVDIVEIDPTLDFRDMTSRLAAYLILQFLLFKK